MSRRRGGRGGNNARQSSGDLEKYGGVSEEDPDTVTRDVILHCFRSLSVPCGRKRHKGVTCPDNPYCIQGIAEVPSLSEALKHTLGDDPSILLRGADDQDEEQKGAPPGLRNLGCTCYMNVTLQALHAVGEFRGEVMREGFGGDESCEEVRRLFAAMSVSERRCCDTRQLADALKVPYDVQQDPQELYKLLLDHLDGHVGEERRNLGELPARHFRGALAYATKCLGCQKETVSGGAGFTELDLSLEGHKSVQECLNAFVAPEQLGPENLIMCDGCHKREQVERRTVLERLPSVLALQLMRFTFDLALLSKKKVKTAVSFPATLDLAPYGNFQNPEPQQTVYDLVGVIVHKGPGANGGHYVCYLRPDDRGAKWFEFDDGEVTAVEFEKLVPAQDRQPGQQKPPKLSQAQTQLQQGAYMLIYSQRGRIGCTEGVPAVPEDLARTFVQDNQELHDSAEAYAKRKKEVEDMLSTREAIRDEICDFNHAEYRRQNREYCWISVEWWTKFLTSPGQPPILDCSDVLCQHGMMTPVNLQKLKCISLQHWQTLASMCVPAEGESANDSKELIIPRDACPKCVAAYCKNVRERKTGDKARESAIQQIKASRKAKDADENSMVWISKSWLSEWLKNPSAVDSTSNPLTLITCEHDALSLDSDARQAIPVEAWSYLTSVFLAAVTAFPVSSTEPCILCQEEQERNEHEIERQKPLKETAKQSLPGSLLRPGEPSGDYFKVKVCGLEPGGRCMYVVDGEWARSLRHWANTEEDIEPPTCLMNLRLLCEKHHLLAYDPDELVRRDGGGEEQPFLLVEESEWEELREKRLVDEEKTQCIRFALDSDGVLFVEPGGACKDCYAERVIAEKQSKTVFKSGSLYVHKLAETFETMDEALPPLLAAAAAAPDSDADRGGNSRRSERLRQQKQRRSVVQLKDVCSEWTVRAFKAQLFTEFSSRNNFRCPLPSQQAMICNGILLDDPLKRLQDYEVPNGSTVFVATVLKGCSPDDDPLAEESHELGFAGSVLQSAPANGANTKTSPSDETAEPSSGDEVVFSDYKEGRDQKDAEKEVGPPSVKRPRLAD